ncbi:alpha/beta hydrolase [Planctomycetales bacterium ZRK34]|nr:alpha/beta hydrolase [Planctomycetales bacterium ZRK34]
MQPALFAILLSALNPIPTLDVHRDLTYATVDNTPLQLDLYLPKNIADAPSGTPLVIWIHGGGWVGGNRANPPLLFMAKGGFALASISYRFSQVAKFPAQIHDAKAAVRWLRAHAAEYGYDPNRIGVAGGSAGGHLAALLGTTIHSKPHEGTVGDCLQTSSAVQAVCDTLGPTDLLDYEDCQMKQAADDLVAKLLGGSVKQQPTLARLASPLYFVDQSDPPFLIVHGRLDPLVPVSQAERLHNAQRKAGAPTELLIDPDGGHGNNMFDPATMQHIEQFFRTTLNFPTPN